MQNAFHMMRYIRLVTCKAIIGGLLLSGLFWSQVSSAMTCEQSLNSDPIAPRLAQSKLAALIKAEIALGNIKVQQDHNDSQVLEIQGKNLHRELLYHLGVLREETFRQVNEGTGKPYDYNTNIDLKYDHILIWNKTDKEIEGAYRILDTSKYVKESDLNSIYSHEFLRFKAGFFKALNGGALELGRSFVVPKYQGSTTLSHLWSGIGHYLMARPHLKYMMGLVSMSGSYSNDFKAAVVSYMLENHQVEDGKLVQNISPTRSFEPVTLKNPDLLALLEESPKVGVFSKKIENITGETIPPLYKFYVNLVGARFINFNFDPDFNTVDGFILVDISQISERAAAAFVGSELAPKLINR